jgi:hypothetical protein
MSDTPRTDEARFTSRGGSEVVEIHFARALERAVRRVVNAFDSEDCQNRAQIDALSACIEALTPEPVRKKGTK